MTVLRALIADDEPIARSGIRMRLESQEDVEIVGECEDGFQTVERISETNPDVVFLDINMPGLDGFGVLERVGRENAPEVVFVTAFDHYALKAFRAHAADYLLKPVEDTLFAEALDRVRHRVHERDEPRDPTSLEALIDALRRQVPGDAGSGYLDRLLVKNSNHAFFVDVRQIDWVGTADNYLSVHVGDKSYLVRGRMSELERRLDPRTFMRVHRQALINMDRLVKVVYENGNQPWVILRSGVRLRVGRSFRPRLLDQEL